MKDFIYDIVKWYGKYDISMIQGCTLEEIINNLRIKQKEFGLYKNLYSRKKNKKRALKILIKIKKYIPNNINKFIDFGGGSCDISYYIGKHFKLSKNNIICIDVEEWSGHKWSRSDAITFYTNFNKIKDNSCDVILASHVLHHLKDNEIKTTINEFYRVLKRNGTIILKEHNSTNKNFSKLLDIQHMLYDTVITQNLTYKEFKNLHYSNYKNIKEWNKLFNKFHLKKLIIEKSIDKSYYAIYKKN